MFSLFPEGVKTAVISECGLFRYTLIREWDPSKRGVLWVMLNPSSADETTDDPTVRRCIGYAKAWGFGRITVVNLFAFRATSPRALLRAVERSPRDPVGHGNDRHIVHCLESPHNKGDLVLLAWGAHAAMPELSWRRDEVLRLLPVDRLYCLGMTQSGEPRHPLYCRADLVPCRFVPTAVTPGNGML